MIKERDWLTAKQLAELAGLKRETSASRVLYKAYEYFKPWRGSKLLVKAVKAKNNRRKYKVLVGSLPKELLEKWMFQLPPEEIEESCLERPSTANWLTVEQFGQLVGFNEKLAHRILLQALLYEQKWCDYQIEVRDFEIRKQGEITVELFVDVDTLPPVLIDKWYGFSKKQ